jgi:hypothetical protein
MIGLIVMPPEAGPARSESAEITRRVTNGPVGPRHPERSLEGGRRFAMVRQIEPDLNTPDPAALERRVLRLEARVAMLTRAVRTLTTKVEEVVAAEAPDRGTGRSTPPNNRELKHVYPFCRW